MAIWLVLQQSSVEMRNLVLQVFRNEIYKWNTVTRKEDQPEMLCAIINERATRYFEFQTEEDVVMFRLKYGHEFSVLHTIVLKVNE